MAGLIPARRASSPAGSARPPASAASIAPRQSPDGDQLDIVAVLEIRDGLIQHHRGYWGWYGVAMLSGGRHP